MLFLALRKVQIFKMAPPQVPQPDENSPAAKFPSPPLWGEFSPTPYGYSENPAFIDL